MTFRVSLMNHCLGISCPETLMISPILMQNEVHTPKFLFGSGCDNKEKIKKEIRKQYKKNKAIEELLDEIMSVMKNLNGRAISCKTKNENLHGKFVLCNFVIDQQ